MSAPVDRPAPLAPTRVAPLAVAERWAEVVRSLTLYPETSVRVASSLQAFFEALREELRSGARSVEVTFSAARVWINGSSFEIKDNRKLLWLRDRLYRSDSSGAGFSEGVDALAMLEFSKRLLSLFRRLDRNLSFAELWPEQYSGIAVLERCFDGSFAGKEYQSGGDQRPMVVDKNRIWAEDLSALLGQERIGAAIEELQAKVIAFAGSEARFSEFDLFAEIAALLPAEGLRDLDVAAEMTIRILEELDLQLTQASLSNVCSIPKDDASFRRLLFAIGRSHFGRTVTSARLDDPEKAVASTPSATSVEREAEVLVHEDIDAVLEVLNSAPEADATPDLPPYEDPVEQLGAYLHYLVAHADPSRLVALEAGIGRLLHASGDAGMEVLRHYLDPACFDPTQNHKRDIGRIVAYLSRSGLREHVRRFGLMNADWICREFPHEFLAYLQGLDLRSARDLSELDRVCRLIGPQRFRQCHDLFAHASEFLSGPVAKALFGVQLTSTVPLVRQIYEQDTGRFRADFAHFLRTNSAKGVDQVVLDVLHDPKLMLPGYLSAIAEESREPLAAQRALCVHSAVSATEGSPKRLAQHVRIVGLLLHCDSPQTRALLERLRDERRNLILKKHPGPVRVAAAKVLRALKRGESEQHV